MTLAVHVRVGQVHDEQLVVFPDAGTQEQRPHAVAFHLQATDEARPFVVQALISGAGPPNVAVSVENRECVRVLQDPDPLVVGARRRAEDVLGANPKLARRRVLATAPSHAAAVARLEVRLSSTGGPSRPVNAPYRRS